MRFSYGTLDEEKGVASMALTELYSELLGMGYIRSTDSRAIPLGRPFPIPDTPYTITHAGLERESYLESKHSLASRRTSKEVKGGGHDSYVAYLVVLTMHDQVCPGCTPTAPEKPTIPGAFG